MATNAELQAEVERLQAENTRLREQVQAGPSVRRPAPVKPSFGMSEGTRADLEVAAQRVESGEVKEVVVTDPFTSDTTKVTKANAPQFLSTDETA